MGDLRCERDGLLRAGYVATRLQERLPLSTYRRPLLATGFCGAYTTFSTMQVEILEISNAAAIGWRSATRRRASAPGYLAIWTASASVRRGRVLL